MPDSEISAAEVLNLLDQVEAAMKARNLLELVEQRQGQSTCKGCKRPLDSWTPCVKYREVSIEV